MRRVVAGLLMSLDGVVSSPGEWGFFHYFNDELREGISTGIAQADAVLLGRRTYLEFAELWPKQGSDVLMADFLNHSPKYVVSSTLKTVAWANSHLLTANWREQLANLKAQPGKNILVPGSPRLVASLLHDGLLDELNLNVCPVVVGSGMRLFQDTSELLRLQLIESKTLSNGVIGVSYRLKTELSST